MSKLKITILALFIVIAVALAIGWWEFLGKRANVDAFPLTKSKGDVNNSPLVSILVKNLEIPWALDFLPDNKIIITEKLGRVSVIDLQQQQKIAKVIATIEEVAPVGEGGLLGVAVHPNFEKNSFIYLYYTYQAEGNYFNKVVRYQLKNSQLTNATVMIDDIPGAAIHDGGRLRFGPDGYLYITTGDAQTPEAAQDPQSLAGKILRLTEDGTIPVDNPFPGSPVFSYGHRNPQGIAWDEEGQLWETEHGSSAHDEINLIKAGNNYGWPVVRGEQRKKGMEPPILQSGSTTWAPSGAEILNGILYFTGLRGRALYGFNLKTMRLDNYFSGKFGRMRDIRLGPDKLFYVLTNNRDGRGIPKQEDDMIIVINPDRMP